MEFMREGGVVMWVMLVVALVSLGLAVARRAQGGWVIALHGAVAVVAFGLIGLSLGLSNVMSALQLAPEAQRWMLLEIGTREALNNSLFAGALTLLLGLTSFALYPRREERQARAAA
jgi:hypothetical protein